LSASHTATVMTDVSLAADTIRYNINQTISVSNKF